MYLLSATLTNFKTHRDRNFEFQLGTNAICGENGAGKTSILEAIAWVLFNHRGSYKQEDLIRNGSGSAQVRVVFVSSNDGRTYEVERCTSRGYTLFDPQLGERLNYSRIKDQVEPWLQQHLGVPIGTDLSRLFVNTIGVPQGTFTADFLLTTEQRKPIFDRVLKVEEYRQVYKDSNNLRRYAEAQVDLLKTQLQQYEEQLQTWDGLQQRHDVVQQDMASSEVQIATLQQELDQLQTQKADLDRQQQQIQTLKQQLQQLTTQLEAKQQTQQIVAQNRLRSQQAADLCHTHRSAYIAYTEAEKALQILGQKQTAQQQLLKQQQTQQRNLNQQTAAMARLQVQLEQRHQLQTQLQALKPQGEHQVTLEAQQRDLIQRQQILAQGKVRRQGLQETLGNLQREHQKTDLAIKALEALQVSVDSIPTLEQQQRRWQQQLSRIDAAQQFETELRQLVATHSSQTTIYNQQTSLALEALKDLPQRVSLLSRKLIDQLKTAIATGQTLSQGTLHALTSILRDLSQQIDAQQIQHNLKTGQAQLKTAYGHQAQLANYPHLQQKQAELATQQRETQQAITELDQQLTQLPELTQALNALQAEIKGLNDPQGRQRLLQEQLQAMASVEADHRRLESNRQVLEQILGEITSQLTQFEALDQELTQQQTLRQGHQTGYLIVVQNEKDAQALEQLNLDWAATSQVVTDLIEQQTSLSQQLEQMAVDFDAEALQRLDQRLGEVKSMCDRITGSLPQQRKLEAELTHQLNRLKQVADKRDQIQIDIKHKERIKRFIKFARRAYKEAGPRITERYVRGISQEADRLFRELINRPNVGLEWAYDYEIIVNEGGNKRRFINLSGGEQMCAALAVRLALLKVLADIDIAFFDEPTTNMDRPRRESLAEAIARLKSFKQLFVISHDDTFEKVTENVIVVEREI